jgi:hypothetical protein
LRTNAVRNDRGGQARWHRAPHAWLADGRSTIDLFGIGFTLLTLGFAGDVAPLTAAAADRGVPIRSPAMHPRWSRPSPVTPVTPAPLDWTPILYYP